MSFTKEDFIAKVSEMRTAQKQYFKTRGQDWLNRSKALLWNIAHWSKQIEERLMDNEWLSFFGGTFLFLLMVAFITMFFAISYSHCLPKADWRCTTYNIEKQQCIQYNYFGDSNDR